MSRRTVLQIGLAVALAGLALLAWLAWREDEPAEQNARALAAQAERAEVETARDARWERIQQESAQLIPPALGEVRLGQRLAEVREARPRMGREPIEQRGRVEPGMQMFEEDLPNGARAVYAFERDSGRLQRLQVLSLLPGPEAIAPHLAAMNERYGTPTGAWDCPRTGNVPTRRFTWRHGQTTVSDIYLIYGGRVSQTLYIAPNGIIARSLRMAGCRPLDAESLERFPVASPEQLTE